jgi:hypothetical protein
LHAFRGRADGCFVLAEEVRAHHLLTQLGLFPFERFDLSWQLLEFALLFEP